MRGTKSLGLAALIAATLLPTVAQADPPEGRGWRSDKHWDRGRHDGRGDRGRDDWRWQGDRNGNWDPRDHYRSGDYRERRLGRSDRIYRGGDGRYYCRRNNGTTGLVIGALGGGLLGNALGGDTLGTLLGAGGGALLGREVDRGGVRCR